MKNNPHVNGESARQRISLNLNSELCHDENGFQGFAERVPRHDFVSNAEICRNSQPGTVAQRRMQSIPALLLLFLSSFDCSIVPMFFCSIVPLFSRAFLLPCSLFDILTSQGENKSFHSDRAPHRDSDHRDFSLNAAACVEQGKRKSTVNSLHCQFEADFTLFCPIPNG